MDGSKVCFKCNCLKPLSEFYKHTQMADGHLNKCIECTKLDSSKRRAEKIDDIREYDRKRSKLPNRIKNAIAQTKKWRNEDMRRSKCHSAVARALKNGTLVPCECAICGSEKTVAHHEDYDKPLDVIWLCQVHHKQRHKEMMDIK